MSAAVAPNMNLPVKSGEDFVGEFETMDISELKGKQYLVAVSSGGPDSLKYVCSTIRGPFSFEEMVEAVGNMWQEHQHHARVIVASKDHRSSPKYLDSNTIDYIEAKFADIITESMLEGVFDNEKDYTCRAGIIEDKPENNPLIPKQEISGNIEEDVI